jgi:hypothetical protein
MFSGFTQQDIVKINSLIRKKPQTETMLKKALGRNLFESLLKNDMLEPLPLKKRERSLRYILREDLNKSLMKIEPLEEVKVTENFIEMDQKKEIDTDKSDLEYNILSIMSPQFEHLNLLIKELDQRLIVIEQIIKEKFPEIELDSLVTQKQFKKQLFQKYFRLTNLGSNGSVPIALLWDEMAMDMISRDQFEEGLLLLEKNKIIQLHSIKDPTAIIEPEKSIRDSTRGWITKMSWISKKKK